MVSPSTTKSKPVKTPCIEADVVLNNFAVVIHWGGLGLSSAKGYPQISAYEAMKCVARTWTSCCKVPIATYYAISTTLSDCAVWGPHPGTFKDSGFTLGGPYGMQGIKPGSPHARQVLYPLYITQ